MTKLRTLIYLGRHGQRAPIRIPAAINRDWTGSAVLTSLGENTQHARGQWLSQRLRSRPEIRIQCSKHARTVDSAMCLLAGLAGEDFRSQSGLDILQKSKFLGNFGARLDSAFNDRFYRSYTRQVSPGVGPIMKTLLKSALERKQHFAVLQPHLSGINAMFGLPQTTSIQTYEDAYYLRDILHCYHAHGLKLPVGFEDGVCYRALEFTDYFLSYDLRFISPTLRRLANHFIFTDLIHVLTERQTSPLLFYYDSSHDRSIYGHVLGMGYDAKTMPTFSSGLVIERFDDGSVNMELCGRCINRYIFHGKEKGNVDQLVEILAKETFADEGEFVRATG